jgi:Bromodomain
MNNICRTPAGRNFKALVEQLWPEYADAYATKIPHRIDLSIIQTRLKDKMYSSIDDFKTDVVLLYQNNIDFNGIDHIITSTALEVRDAILKATNDIEKRK